MFRIFFLYLLIGHCTLIGYAQSNPKQATNPVKIGLLISDKNAVAAKHGAELAILQANKKGGFNGLSYELVVRSMEGPWGTGAKEAVKMIFDDEVCAIMGSTDGRNAHLVEQVTTKSRTVFLSAWSGDPTLSQAFVPWFFSCVPNNNQQAAILVDEIYSKQSLSPVGLISDLEYDSQSALKGFLNKAKVSGKPDPVKFSVNNTDLNFTDLLNQLVKADLKAVVLFVKPGTAAKIIQQLQSKKMNFPVYSTLSVLNENEVTNSEMKTMQNQIRVTTSPWLKSNRNLFNEEFQLKYGNLPGTTAIFAYDGMNLLIEAIKKGGFERENIQKSLSEIHYKGVSGLIQFDRKGNRSGSLILTPTKDGTPVNDGTPAILEK
jgi:branched-chain amino acid transport system substrate-binding protein